MVTTYMINSIDDANANTDWGIQKDAYMYRGAPTTNYTSSSFLVTGDEDLSTDPDYTILFELIMPESPIEGAEVDHVMVKFCKVSSRSIAASPSNYIYPSFYPLDNPFESGFTWNRRKTGVDWKKDGGDFSESSENAIDGGSNAYAFINSSLETDWTYSQYNFQHEPLDWGDVKQYAIRHDKDTDADWELRFASNRFHDSAYRPKIEVYYTIPAPSDVFKNETDKLSVEPNESNRAQALLKWGGYKNSDYKNYKVYRRAAANAARSTTLTTITDSGKTEYIDVLSTTGDAIYYYQASISIEDDYGNIVSTLSSEVEFWRPKTTTFTVTSTTPDAWSLVTGTITGSVTNKPTAVSTAKYIYDWEGDGVATQIRNLTAHASTDNTTHRYTSAGARTPRARIEDNKGFQSDYTSASAVTVGGLSPVGVIRGPTYVEKSTSYYFRGDESYDQNSDGSLVSWAWDYSLNGSFTSNLKTTAGVASISWSYTGDKTLALKVRDDDGNQSASVVWTVEVYDGTPTVLHFDEDTTRVSTVNANNGEALFAENLWLGKSGSQQRGELIWTGQDFPNININGWSEGDAGQRDVSTLLSYNDTPTKLKIWVTSDKLWLIGYLTDFNVDEKGGELKQFYWSANFVCEEKSNGS